MVETQEITKAVMLDFYALDLVWDMVNTGNRIYAKTRAELHNQGYKSVVWCPV